MTYADRIPAPRPIPTTRQRLTDARACGHTPEQHRHDDGQAADAASHDRAIRELTAERDGLRDDIQRVEQTRQEQVTELRQQLDAMKAAKKRILGRLEMAEHVIDLIRDASEQQDRALAAWDTQPGVTPVDEYHAAGVYCGESAHCTPPHPDALPGTPYDQPEDLRSPLAAERDKLVDTIGRLVSLPPEQIAKMHKVGYSGMSTGLGSAPPRAQGPRPGQFCTEHFSWLCQAGQGRCQGKREG